MDHVAPLNATVGEHSACLRRHPPPVEGQRPLAAEGGYCGTLHQIALVDLLQTLHLSRASLLVELDPPAGLIAFRTGEVVHVVAGSTEGREALGQLLRHPVGRFGTRALPPRLPSTIDLPFQALLLDLLREADEAARSAVVLDHQPWGPGGVRESDSHAGDPPVAEVRCPVEEGYTFDGGVAKAGDGAEVVVAAHEGPYRTGAERRRRAGIRRLHRALTPPGMAPMRGEGPPLPWRAALMGFALALAGGSMGFTYELMTARSESGSRTARLASPPRFGRGERRSGYQEPLKWPGYSRWPVWLPSPKRPGQPKESLVVRQTVGTRDRGRVARARRPRRPPARRWRAVRPFAKFAAPGSPRPGLRARRRRGAARRAIPAESRLRSRLMGRKERPITDLVDPWAP